MVLHTAEVGIGENGIVSYERLRIYTGVLGQIGDIVMFTPTVRRIKELFPRSEITFAVSSRYRAAGELVAGLPYVDRLFVTELYFEKLTPALFQPWERGWPVDFRGSDEVREQRRHDLVLETRPRHRRKPWWEYASMAAEMAHMVGVPGVTNLSPEIRIPVGISVPAEAQEKIVLHNDPCIDTRKGWSWEHAGRFVQAFPPGSVVLIGHPGPELPGVLDLRGRTSLVEAAALIGAARCFVGVESGPTCIAAALQAPTVGLFGTGYIGDSSAAQPLNPQATYLQTDGTLDGISSDAVIEAVQHRLARSSGS